MKKISAAFRRHSYIYTAILVVIIGIAIYSFARGNGNGVETMTVSRGDFKRSVSISGNVKAAESAELGFEQGGRIAGVYATVGTRVAKGTLVASIENGDIRADVLQKQAALEREKAKLASLSQGTRTEQLEIDRQAYSDASRSLAVALRSAHLDAEDAIVTDIDTMFTNANTWNPDIAIRTSSYQEEAEIERTRLKATEDMAKWKSELSGLTEPIDPAKLDATIVTARTVLSSLKSFTDRMSSIAGALTVGNSGKTQAEIDAYRVSANTAGQTITDAMTSLQTAETAWSRAKKSLNLSESGSTRTDIAAQTATVKAAEADLLSAQARLGKSQIIAPFDGIVTRMDAKVGEIVSPNSSKISLMSSSAFEIESYVPEVHIASIRPGNPVTATLDAYGSSVVFKATVTSIDPAETIRDGVSTYKVKMAFNEQDERIRSGMTASAVIVTLEKPDTIVIPRSVITNRDGQSYVTVLDEDHNETEVPITTGDSTSLGQIEVVSGLNEGDVIVLDKPE